MKLTKTEERALREITLNGKCQLGTGKLPQKRSRACTIRAKFLRHLLFKLPISGSSGVAELSQGIHLTGAWIAGSIDLKGLNRGRSAPAPPLRLEYCHIERERNSELDDPDIDFSDAKMSRLSLKGSRFVYFIAANASFSSTLDLSEVASAQQAKHASGCPDNLEDSEDGAAATANQPQCMVDLASARLGGNLRLASAKLVVRKKEEAQVRESIPSALRLNAAHIHGSVFLSPNVSLHGGLNAQGLVLSGNLWAYGLKASCEWDAAVAIGLSVLHCRGSLYFGRQAKSSTSSDEREFTCKGVIDLYGCRVGGEVLIASGDPIGSNPGTSVIKAYQSHIRGHFRIGTSKPISAKGSILVTDSKIGSLEVRVKPDGHLDLKKNRVTGEVTVHIEPSETERVNLLLSQNRVRGRVRVSASAGLSLGNVDLDCLASEHNIELSGFCANTINFAGAVCEHDLVLDNLKVRQRLIGGGVRVGRDMSIRSLTIDHKYGERRDTPDDTVDVSLGGARIKGALAIKGFNWLKPPFRNIKVAFKRTLDFYPKYCLVYATSGDSAIEDHQAFLWDGQAPLIRLPGKSNPIHEINQRLRKDRRFAINKDTVRDYLAFFCAHVWGDEGAFRIVTDESRLKYEAQSVDEKHKDDFEGNLIKNDAASRLVEFKFRIDGTSWIFEKVPVIYGWCLFQADFKVSDGGIVEMLRDERICNFAGEDPVAFDRDRGVWRLKADVSSANGDFLDWPGAGNAVAQNWEAVDTGNVAFAPGRHLRKPIVDLSFSQCGHLQDEAGRAWRDESSEAQVQLRLDAFEYHLSNEALNLTSSGVQAQPAFNFSAAPRHDEFKGREAWLRLQYLDDREPRSSTEFNARTYDYLARLYRSEGRPYEAMGVVRERIRLEAKLRNDQWRERWRIRMGSKIHWGPVVGRTVWSALWLLVFIALTHDLNIPAESGGRSVSWMIYGLLVALAALFWWTLAEFRGWLDVVFRVAFDYGLTASRASITFLGCVCLGWFAFWNLNTQGKLIVDETPVELRADLSTARDLQSTKGGSRFCGGQISPLLYSLDVFIPLIDLRQEIRCRPDPAFPHWQFLKTLFAACGWIVTSLLILAVTGVIRRRAEG